MGNSIIIKPEGSTRLEKTDLYNISGGYICVCANHQTSSGGLVAYICQNHCYHMGEMFLEIGKGFATAAQAISKYGTKLSGVAKGWAEFAAFTCGIAAWRFISEGNIYKSAGINSIAGYSGKGVRINMAAGTTTYGLVKC